VEAEVQADGEPAERAAEHGVRPATIAQARALARSRLRGFDARLVDDCLLVVSELVTNAIRHGGGLAGFDVTALPGHVTVSVQDLSSELPVGARPSGNWLPGGYGWPMVCRLAKQVTISLLEGGGKAIHVSIAR
jgi:anti-sigma regulatory factor (Ser/Thr protein kinase)